MRMRAYNVHRQWVALGTRLVHAPVLLLCSFAHCLLTSLVCQSSFDCGCPSPLHHIMAEFARNIIGIVSAGTKVALVLSQLAADVGLAGHEARMIGGEIRSLCSVLRALGDAIETLERSPRYAHCSELISDMADDSLQMFTEVLDAVDKMRKMTSGREGRDGNFGLVERLQWAVFKKPKLLVLRAAIEAYKTNLTLMLSTLSTVERTARPMYVYLLLHVSTGH